MPNLGAYATTAFKILALAVCGQAACAREVPIDGRADLLAAISGAAPGDTLLLAPGDYGILTINDLGGTKDQPIVLRSADMQRPAIVEQLDLENASHITFEDLIFDYRFSPEDPYHIRAFRVSKGRDIAFRRILVDGDEATGRSPEEDGFGFAYGFGVEESAGVTIEDCEIRTFARGMVISQSQDITVQRNDVHDLRSDGMDFAEVRHVLIAENYIHDFRTAPESNDHPDMIQFWTSGTETPSIDITIRDNLLNSREGPWTQSIFMRNERVDTKDAGPEMFYRDIKITGNVIMNAHLHGITVGETDNLTISENTLVQNSKSLASPSTEPLWVPKIFVAESSRNVRITRNVMDKIVGHGRQSDWTVKDNITIQNQTRSQAGFYGDVFIGGVGGDPGNPDSFAYRPGGPLYRAGIGAPRLQEEPVTLPGPRK